MALTSEEAKRFIAALLQACLNVVQQTELTGLGDSDTLVFTQQPIDFTDPRQAASSTASFMYSSHRMQKPFGWSMQN